VLIDAHGFRIFALKIAVVGVTAPAVVGDPPGMLVDGRLQLLIFVIEAGAVPVERALHLSHFLDEFSFIVVEYDKALQITRR